MAPNDYAETIARATALVYGVPEEKVLAAARMRAEAMVYRDARRDGKMTEADWQEIARQLMLAYASFKEIVAHGRRVHSLPPGKREHVLVPLADPVSALITGG